MNSISLRINELALEIFNGNNTEFALALETSEANIRNYRKNTTPKVDFINLLHEKFEINFEWLINGKGVKRKIATYFADSNEENDIPIVARSKEGIPLIPIEAMAGYGQGSEQVLELDCERFVVPTFRGADYLIQIKGSSMYPKYNSGDIVACKNLVLADAFFQWNKVYVLDTDQGALIKRVKKSTAENTISLVSDNLNYDPFDMELNKIHAIAIVMGVIRME